MKKPKLVKKSNKVKTAPPKVEEKTQNAYANLDEVMDFTVPFELIYSGVENDSYFEILYEMGIRNFLMSYHYIQTKHLSLAKKFEGEEGIRLFIDSGAHTYMNDPKYAEYDTEYWENHLKGYLKWAERNKDYIFAIANFDFEDIVGGEVVNRWNREYFEPFMLRTGIPVCFVWHNNSYETWEFYCKRYPYTGFSSVNTSGEQLDLGEYKDRLKTAEKNRSLVHGFGMTKTSLLTQLPFYTSDSTTWLVGLQYGEINYWTGTKMSRLKKDQWKNKFAEEICSRYDLDYDRFLGEEVVEMIKANIGAFIDAEKFVQDRLRSQMYWLRPTSVKTDVDNLPEDFFPPVEWFDNNETEGFEEYCRKMNLNPEVETARNLLYDITAFMNWETGTHQKMVDWYSQPEQEDLITELHDMFINRIVPDKETKIQDIINFFRDCIAGNNDKLLNLGTNFDRIVKERKDEEYVMDDEEELVDLSPEEVRLRLQHLLPDKSMEEGAPEIDCLDEEIFRKVDIVPTFDERGKFVKGQVAVRKPKQVYSDKFPKLACDNCFNAAKCPEYKSGYVCAFNKMFKRFDSRSMSDVIQSVQGIVDYNMQRMQRSMITEMLNGTIDPVTSQLMDTNIRYMQMLKQMYENASPEVLRQTKVVRADGTEETTTSITNPQSGGIMEKLFGSMMARQQTPEEDVIDVTAEEAPKKVNDRYKNIEED